MTDRSNSMFQNLQNSLTSLSHYETDTNQHITDEHAIIIKLANETDDLVRYTKLLEPIIQKSIILLNNIDTYNSIYAEIEENIKIIVFNKLPMSLIIDQPEDINNIDNKNIKSTVKLTTKGFKINPILHFHTEISTFSSETSILLLKPQQHHRHFKHKNVHNGRRH